jgi:CubicO group peptidase (beta-lactamase class C family)
MYNSLRQVLAGVMTAGLLLSPAPLHAQTASPTTTHVMATTPASVETALAQLETMAQQEVDQGNVVGMAIAVVYQDELIYSRGFGVRDVGAGTPVEPATVFQLASVSKPLGSTVMAALVGDGAVTWESKIHDLDPAFTLYDPWVTREITLRDLYAHRSGLPEHAGDLLEDLGFGREEVLHRLRYQPPATSFRSHYAYTNFGLAEAAFAAASAAGATWEDLSEERLYARLGMDSTSSRYADLVAQPNRALLHVQEEGEWVQKFERDNDSATPAGGASSNVLDMAQWLRLQLGGGVFDGEPVVDGAALAATHEPLMFTGYSPITGLPGFYGLGWNVGYDAQGRLRLSHSGAFALGAATNVALVPDEQLGIVILSNSYPVGIVEALGQTFIDLALHGEVTADWLSIYKQAFSNPAALGVDNATDYSAPPTAPTPPLDDAAYLGVYTNDFFGDATIRAGADGLELVLGPQPLVFPLQHYDRDTFLYTTVGENAVGASGVIFTVGSNGQARSIFMEHLNRDGLGVFVRSAP